MPQQIIINGKCVPLLTCHARAHDPNTGKKAELSGWRSLTTFDLTYDVGPARLEPAKPARSRPRDFGHYLHYILIGLRIRPRERLSYCKL